MIQAQTAWAAQCDCCGCRFAGPQGPVFTSRAELLRVMRLKGWETSDSGLGQCRCVCPDCAEALYNYKFSAAKRLARDIKTTN